MKITQKVFKRENVTPEPDEWFSEQYEMKILIKKNELSWDEFESINVAINSNDEERNKFLESRKENEFPLELLVNVIHDGELIAELTERYNSKPEDEQIEIVLNI